MMGLARRPTAGPYGRYSPFEADLSSGLNLIVEESGEDLGAYEWWSPFEGVGLGADGRVFSLQGRHTGGMLRHGIAGGPKLEVVSGRFGGLPILHFDGDGAGGATDYYLDSGTTEVFGAVTDRPYIAMYAASSSTNGLTLLNTLRGGSTRFRLLRATAARLQGNAVTTGGSIFAITASDAWPNNTEAWVEVYRTSTHLEVCVDRGTPVQTATADDFTLAPDRLLMGSGTTGPWECGGVFISRIPPSDTLKTAIRDYFVGLYT